MHEESQIGYYIKNTSQIFKTELDAEEWLNSYESGLPKTPMEYLKEGRFDIVEKLLGMIESGIPS
jgi:Protein of unknown function (DUF2384)